MGVAATYGAPVFATHAVAATRVPKGRMPESARATDPPPPDAPQVGRGGADGVWPLPEAAPRVPRAGGHWRARRPLGHTWR